MALNDIKVPKENASGTFDEITLAASDLKLGTTANLPLKTGTSGVIEAGSFGTAAGSFCEGNDVRLSDDRDPNAHAASHLPDGADEIFDQSLNTTDSVTFLNLHIDGGDLTGVGQLAFDSGAGQSVTISEAEISFTGAAAATTLTNIGAAASGSITSSGLTQSTARILGRTTASTGAVEEIQIGSGLSLSAGELSSTVSAGIPATIVDAKGDLIVASAADTVARLPVGATNGHALVVDSAETLGIKWAAVSGVTSGSVDNAVLRANGTGGASSQSSALVIEDVVTAFTTITGDAGTDIITATGSAFANGQRVRFTALTGGSGLNTTTNYFVINVSGATFQLSTTDGGSASLFTTNITAGTLLTGHAVQTLVRVSNVASDTNSALVLSPKGGGAFVLGPQPDASSSGGNARGVSAVELQMVRTSATAVASGERAFIGGGANNTGSGQDSVCSGGTGNTASGFLAGIFSGRNNVANNDRSMAAGDGNTSSNTDSFAVGSNNTASAVQSVAIGTRAVADRQRLLAHSSGFFAANGDAQRIRAVLRCKTTTNAAVEMALDGSTTYLTIPSGKVVFCNIKVVGVKSDGAVVATYERQYAAKNVAGTSSEVFAPVTIGTDNASSTSLEVATVDAGDYIRIRPTGITSETWRWVASVDAVEVAYGS
jgi:hypothetical protein